MTLQGEKSYNMEIRKASLSEICSLVGEQFIGEDVEINGLNLCDRFSQYESILGYTTSPKFFNAILANPAVKVLVLKEELYKQFEPITTENKRAIAYVINPQPEYLFYDIHNDLWDNTCFYDKHQQDTIVGVGCDIHPSVVVEKGVVIGNHVKIRPNSVVRGGSIIDNNVWMAPNAVIMNGVHVSDNGFIGAMSMAKSDVGKGEVVVGIPAKVLNVLKT